ncbi:MAG TPA: type I methionyl aminopeptidase, partial [Elusimicrobiota bacterium]|nr:type I methionyl aminopeptidase [Elusimicrobiota bacterium]
PREIDLLRGAGRLAAEILMALKGRVTEGMTTREIDVMAEKMMRSRDAVPSFLNYRGYPATVCTSVNDEVVHAIPGPRRLKKGDILSLDIGMFLEGYCGDTATTFAIGEASDKAARLMKAGRESLQASIDAAVVGNRLGDVSHAMQSVVETAGYHVVREYGGHGIGRAMHEEPHVPCYGKAGTGIRLVPGMVLALEVMANEGTAEIRHKPDHWTVVTADGSLSVHYEKMVAITDNGVEVLTPHVE